MTSEAIRKQQASKRGPIETTVKDLLRSQAEIPLVVEIAILTLARELDQLKGQS